MQGRDFEKYQATDNATLNCLHDIDLECPANDPLFFESHPLTLYFRTSALSLSPQTFQQGCCSEEEFHLYPLSPGLAAHMDNALPPNIGPWTFLSQNKPTSLTSPTLYFH